MKIKSLIASSILAFSSLGILALPVDASCANYSTQQEAQRNYRGSLDRDGDGIACEHLPYGAEFNYPSRSGLDLGGFLVSESGKTVVEVEGRRWAYITQLNGERTTGIISIYSLNSVGANGTFGDYTNGMGCRGRFQINWTGGDRYEATWFVDGTTPDTRTCRDAGKVFETTFFLED